MFNKIVNVNGISRWLNKIKILSSESEIEMMVKYWNKKIIIFSTRIMLTHISTEYSDSIPTFPPQNRKNALLIWLCAYYTIEIVCSPSDANDAIILVASSSI